MFYLSHNIETWRIFQMIQVALNVLDISIWLNQIIFDKIYEVKEPKTRGLKINLYLFSHEN